MSTAPIFCPVCQTPVPFEPVSTYTVGESAAHFCPPARDPERTARMEQAIRAIWQQEECWFVRCSACTHGFCVPFRGGDDAFFSIHNETFDYPKWKWDYDFGLARISPLTGPRRLLDIGAGMGLFLDKLPANWEKVAAEGSEQTRNYLRNKGIKVILPEDAPGLTGSFDVVTIFQVLELIADFRGMLGMARTLLKPGGILIIAVPECDAMIWQEKVLECPDMPPFHVNKWSIKSLSTVLASLGFTVERSEMEPKTWGNVYNALYMKIMELPRRKGSLAWRIYNLHNRKLRILGMAGLSLLYLVRFLPNLSLLFKSRHFALIAIRNDD